MLPTGLPGTSRWVAAVAATVVFLAGVVVLPGVRAPAAASAQEEASAPRAITYDYCVRGRGVSAEALEGFAPVAAQVLAERAGWSLGGTLRFLQRSACDGTHFTLWLSAAPYLPSFGYPCSPAWSCRQGRNVIINLDRWRSATTSWHAAGAPLADYRRMVVNHEVGHWLGFGHVFCPAAGAPAPVMQQQSKSLQGCRANPHPTASERSRAAQRRNLSILGPIRDGEFVRAAGNPTVYLVERGHLRAIPDPATLQARAPSGGWVRRVAAVDLETLPRGASVPSVTRPLDTDGTLLRPTGTPTVWLVMDGHRHRVPDGCTFRDRGLWWSDVREVSDERARALPVGVPLRSTCGEPPPTPRDLDRACPDGRVPEDGLGDADGSVHEAAIDCALWWGLSRGAAGGGYAPAVAVTRAQIASLLARMVDVTEGELPVGEDRFGDDDGSVHEDNINALAAAGIVAGTSAGYQPGRAVSRGEMASLLVRVYEYRSGRTLDASRDYFGDDLGSRHQDAINRATEAGFTAGTGDGYAPQAAVTRAQVASSLLRVTDRLVVDLDIPLPAG